MKIALTGKGGVGKTTLTTLLSMTLAGDGKKVLLIDADPDADLALSLGIPAEVRENLTPIAQMEDLIEERTGAKKGSYGGLFKLNPEVDDIVDKYAYKKGNIRLLTFGAVKSGGSGCYCAENVLLKRLTAHIISQPDQVVILDMEAGIEHLTRGTARFVDTLVTVVDSDMRSLKSALTIRKLANEIGIQRVFAIGNKTRNDNNRRFIEEKLEDIPLLGFISYSGKVLDVDFEENGLTSLFKHDPLLEEELNNIRKELSKRI